MRRSSPGFPRHPNNTARNDTGPQTFYEALKSKWTFTVFICSRLEQSARSGDRGYDCYKPDKIKNSAPRVLCHLWSHFRSHISLWEMHPRWSLDCEDPGELLFVQNFLFVPQEKNLTVKPAWGWIRIQYVWLFQYLANFDPCFKGLIVKLSLWVSGRSH